MKPAIVVASYNRTESLKRLLSSISIADYKEELNIPLVISIDKSDNPEVNYLAEKFIWPFGEKRIILQKERQGLKNHIISCGNLTKEYGSIILLEDDLFVSPLFYKYAINSLTFFNNNNKIAGIALYSPNYNETSQMNFQPINNGYTNYFSKVPCSSGQAWDEIQWNGFSKYLTNQETNDISLPLNVQSWNSMTSWKKAFYAYLISQEKYFAYPYYAFSTNFNDPGQHYAYKLNLFQCNLIHNFNNFNFNNDFKTSIVYDEYGELEPLVFKSINTLLSEYDFEVDIYGSKQIEHIKKPYLLSIRSCNNPLFSFGVEMIPPENNVLFNIEGDFFHFGKTSEFIDSNNIWKKKEILSENMSKIPIKGMKESISNKMKNTRDYKLGHFLLKPFRFFR